MFLLEKPLDNCLLLPVFLCRPVHQMDATSVKYSVPPTTTSPSWAESMSGSPSPRVRQLLSACRMNTTSSFVTLCIDCCVHLQGDRALTAVLAKFAMQPGPLKIKSHWPRQI